MMQVRVRKTTSGLSSQVKTQIEDKAYLLAKTTTKSKP